MPSLRVLWRVLACAVVTAFFAALTPAARLVARDEAKVARLQAKLSGRWGRALCAILGVERSVQGAVPAGAAFLVASNHVSYLDILVLLAGGDAGPLEDLLRLC